MTNRVILATWELVTAVACSSLLQFYSVLLIRQGSNNMNIKATKLSDYYRLKSLLVPQLLLGKQVLFQRLFFFLSFTIISTRLKLLWNYFNLQISFHQSSVAYGYLLFWFCGLSFNDNPESKSPEIAQKNALDVMVIVYILCCLQNKRNDWFHLKWLYYRFLL